MNEALRFSKKAFTWGVVATTIAWSVGAAALPMTANAAATLTPGSLIKSTELPTVYFYASNGKRYVFPTQKTYNSWYKDFSGVVKISVADMNLIPVGGNITYRAGTRLIKIDSDPKTYAVEPGGKLRWITSETVAKSLWGAAWNKRVDDVPVSFFTNYTSGTDLTTNAYPTGSLVKAASGSDMGTYYVDGSSKRLVSDAAFAANNFRSEFVNVTSVDLSALTAGAALNGKEDGLVDASQSGSVTAGPVNTGSSLMLSAASDNPAGGTLVSDSGSDSQQALAPVLKLHFSAPNDGAVTVNSLKLTRSGIASDSDLQDVYLYNGNDMSKLLARSNSISAGKVTFSNAGGLFTVAAGSSMDVLVRVDTAKAVSAGKTLSFSVAAADVTPASAGTSVSGSATGATYTMASVSDLGRTEVTNVNPAAAGSVDPQSNYELWRFSVKAVDQPQLVKWLRITNAGSIGASDIQNLKLYDGTTQIGSTVASLNSNMADFDLSMLSGGGLALTSGQTKQLSLRGDIVGGTNRTYRFGIRNSYDFVAYDTNYNVYVRPVKGASGTSFSVVEPNDGSNAVDQTISTGKLTIQKASDSPASNVPSGATGVTLAKFNFAAAGEDVKVNSMSVKCSSGDTTTIAKNVKLYFDGSQVGANVTSLTCNNSSTADYTFGNSFVVPFATTKGFSIVADLNDATVAANDTLTFSIVAGTGTAEGRTSLTSINVTAASANTVTVKGGVITLSTDSAYANRSSSNPTGVVGATNVTLGQFVITGGGEDADVNQIVLKDTASDGYVVGNYFQNLKLWDDKGNQVGSTISSLTATDATTFTFTPASALRVTAGGTRVFKVTADVKSGVAGGAFVGTSTAGPVGVSAASATGVTTGGSASAASGITSLQAVYLATNGNLSVYPSSATPVAGTLVMGATDQELARFTLAANQNEDINVTKLVVSDLMTLGGASAATGTLKNVRLVDATTGVQYGGSLSSFDVSTSLTLGTASFDNINNLTVPKNGSVNVKVVADVTSFTDGGVSSSSHKLTIYPDAVNAASTESSTLTVVATGKDSGWSISGTSLDFNANSTNSNTDTMAYGNAQSVFKTKITIAKASDAPSGLQGASSELTVAKFVVTNSANVGNYKASISNLNFTIGSTISTTAARNLKVYKNSVSNANLLASTTTVAACASLASNCGFYTTGLTAANFNSNNPVDIDAGTSLTFILTADTTDAAQNKTFTASLATGNVVWSDSSTTGITQVDSLPVNGNTLTF